MADAFGYSQEAGRFRDLSTGRFISEREVRDFVDNIADHASRRMGELTASLRAGDLDLTTWQQSMMVTIKDAQISAALAAYGGRDQMTPARWGSVGQTIRQEFAYLRQMASDLVEGRQRWNGRADARARQYGQSARTRYENIRRREQAQAGMQWESNVLHASESCDQCISQSDAGWVPIGTLVAIGMRICRGNCRCTLAFAKQRPAQEEAA